MREGGREGREGGRWGEREVRGEREGVMTNVWAVRINSHAEALQAWCLCRLRL